MADWPHIVNGKISANMSKVNGIAKANIHAVGQITGAPPGPYPSALIFDMLATEEELKLTYEEFVTKRANDFYTETPNIFDGKTSEEKEDIILNLVGEGELFADVAIKIARREGLDVDY